MLTYFNQINSYFDIKTVTIWQTRSKCLFWLFTIVPSIYLRMVIFTWKAAFSLLAQAYSQSTCKKIFSSSYYMMWIQRCCYCLSSCRPGEASDVCMHSGRESCVVYLIASSNGTTNSLSPIHHPAHGDLGGGRLTLRYMCVCVFPPRNNTVLSKCIHYAL